MKLNLIFLVLLFCVVTLAACVSQAAIPTSATAIPTFTPAPTATPQPTATSTPSPTSTPKPTNTPQPTNTPKPTETPVPLPTLSLGKAQVVTAGGYSFRPVLGYDTNVKNGNVSITDKAGRLIIAMSGVTANSSRKSAGEIMDDFMDAVAKAAHGEFNKGAPHKITIGGVDGIAVDVTGTLSDKPLRGQSVIVMPSKTQFLYGLAVSNTGADKMLWEKEGSRVFSAVLNSVKFVEPSTAGNAGNAKSSCPVSTDTTYGYTKANPIKVGGGDFGGPPREREYLDVLRGSNNEALSYERLGSLPFDNTILDIYEIKGLKKAATLYVDEYSYTEPKAPTGFICASPFTLTAP